MKYIFSWLAFLMVFLFVLPMMFFDGTTHEQSMNQSAEIKVYFHETAVVKTMDLEKYLMNVLMAEMPAKFESEALKAQAVAARTYTINKIKSKDTTNVHPDADVCTDFAHCQAYISKDVYMNKNGKNASEYIKKFKKSRNIGIFVTFHR